MTKAFDFVVFSHLRWDFVFQRPQHLLSRFAEAHRVIFIEEPIRDEGPAHWEFRSGENNVIVCRPHLPLDSHGFSDANLAAIGKMLPELTGKFDLRSYIAWFYTPMALPLLKDINPGAVVYDCMDELSAFLGAARELLDREERLLQIADLVFTGGPSLYLAKKNRNPNVHCFPSSVDAKHYAQARPGGNIEADDQKSLPQPRLGYFGVIDERIDLDLLDAVAKARPDWQISMVGPVVKIDPASLPRHANIHYFGQRNYAQLPTYLAGWNVCILPFAMNASTKFISPTKTLEYMAAERMIVSTPITDVAEPYGKIVYIAGTAAQFVESCDAAMHLDGAERAMRVRGMRDVLSRTSWDSTAARMLELINRRMGVSAKPEEALVMKAAGVLVAGSTASGD